MVRQVANSGEDILGVSPCTRYSTAPLDNEIEILMIYETFSSENQRKGALQELGQIHQVAATNSWMDTPITFDEEDEPKADPVRAPAALVLDPIVYGFRLTKVLLDGGSGLNLIYEVTLDKMQFHRSRVEQRY